MICQIHHVKCRQLCMQKTCNKPWAACHKCNHHRNHKLALGDDVYSHLSEISQMHNSFQNQLKNDLHQLLTNQTDRIMMFIKSLIDEYVLDNLKNRIRLLEYGCNPQIELAIRQYQKQGRFKQKHRDKILNFEINIPYLKQIQKQIKDCQSHKIQSVFYNLLHNLKAIITNTNTHSTIDLKENTKQSFYKTRSFSNSSNNTFSTTTNSFQRKRLKSTSKNSLFAHTSKDTIKKVVKNRAQFVQESKIDMNRSGQFLKLIQQKIATRISNDSCNKTKQPLIKQQDYSQIRQPTNTYSNSYSNINNIKQQNRQSINIPFDKNQSQFMLKQKQNNTNPSLFSNQKITSKQTFKQPTHHKQNNRQQRSSIKSVQSSKIQSRNISTNLKRNQKISKKVSIIQNKAEDSFEETIQFQQKRPVNHRIFQQLQTRLKIVPEVHGFLKQRLYQIEEIWKPANDVCWKMYFQIKQKLQITQTKYEDQYQAVKATSYNKIQIVEQLQYNIKNTKIKTISKLRNHLILQYLVKYSAELLILFQGTQIENTGFSAQIYLTILSNLAEGDVKGAFAYMSNNLKKLKTLIQLS